MPSQGEDEQQGWWAKRRKDCADSCDSSPDCDPGCLDLGCDGCDLGCDPCLLLLRAPLMLPVLVLLRGVLLLAWLTPGRSAPSGPAGPAQRSVLDRTAVAAISGYRRWVSPRLRARCRYTPSCSAYGLAAVRRYGWATGSLLAADRITRCTSSVARGTADPLPLTALRPAVRPVLGSALSGRARRRRRPLPG